MKIFMKSLAVLFVFVLGACAQFTAQDAAKLIISANNISYYYENGQVVNLINNPDLPDEDRQEIVSALVLSLIHI